MTLPKPPFNPMIVKLQALIGHFRLMASEMRRMREDSYGGQKTHCHGREIAYREAADALEREIEGYVDSIRPESVGRLAGLQSCLREDNPYILGPFKEGMDSTGCASLWYKGWLEGCEQAKAYILSDDSGLERLLEPRE